jgi:DNA-directed RNA polymerase subunit RPC12/RpoP
MSKQLNELQISIKDCNFNIRQNLQKMLLHAGLQEKRKRLVDYTEQHWFEDHIQPGFLDHVYTTAKTEEVKALAREDFCSEGFYYLDQIGKEWLFNDIKLKPPRWEFITGNDGDLMYWFRCTECGSIIIVDHGDPSYDRPMVCSHCNPVANQPHAFYDIDDEALDVKAVHEFAKSCTKYHSDKLYRLFCDLRFNFMNITYPIRTLWRRK